MTLRSRWLRQAVGSLVLLCPALPGPAAQATSAMHARPPLVDAMVAATKHGPSMAGAPECVACDVAPAPSQHGFGGDSQQPDEPPWPLHAAEASTTLDAFDSGGRRARMPVRIAFCRWLD